MPKINIENVRQTIVNTSRRIMEQKGGMSTERINSLITDAFKGTDFEKPAALLAEVRSRICIDLNGLASRYYKSKEKKSVKMFIDRSVNELFGAETDNKIFKLLFPSDNFGNKTKAEYIKNNNMNFARLISGKDEMYIEAYSQSSFKKDVFDKIEYINLVRINLELLKISTRAKYRRHLVESKGSNDTIEKLDGDIGVMYSEGEIEAAIEINAEFGSRMLGKNMKSGAEYHVMSIIQGIGGNWDKLSLFIMSGIGFEANIDKFVLSILKKHDKKVSLSSLIGSTFDRPNYVSKKLNENSDSVKYEYTNPISGFVSIKRKRVVKSSSSMSQSDIDVLAAEFTLINRIYENSENKIEQYRIEKLKDSVDALRIVSGPEITSLYEITSYYGYSDEISRTGIMPKNTLYNSCMRYTGLKYRINMYSNNPHMIKMIALTTAESNKLKARAIVWYDEDSGDHYVDRIYSYDNESRNTIISFINNTDNFYSIHPGNSIDGDKFKQEFFIKFKYAVQSSIVNTPYLDSVSRYLFYDKDKNGYIGKGSSSYTTKDNGMTASNVDWTLLSKFHKNVFEIHKDSCRLCGESSDNYFAINGSRICKHHLLVNTKTPTFSLSSVIYKPFTKIESNTPRFYSTYIKLYETADGLDSCGDINDLNSINTARVNDKKISVLSSLISNNIFRNENSLPHGAFSEIMELADRDIYRVTRRSTELFYDNSLKPIMIGDNVFMAIRDENHPNFENNAMLYNLYSKLYSLWTDKNNSNKVIWSDAIKRYIIARSGKESLIASLARKDELKIANPLNKIEAESSSSYGSFISLNAYKAAIITDDYFEDELMVRVVMVRRTSTLKYFEPFSMSIPISLFGIEKEESKKKLISALNEG